MTRRRSPQPVSPRGLAVPLPAGAVLLALIVASSAPAPAAVITGQVTADGKPITGAWVQLNTGLFVTTDARGRYAFPSVPRATYALQVFAPGKQPVVRGGLVPAKGDTSFDLKPAAAPLGLVHITAVRADRTEPCPVRIVTRWRAAGAAEFATPQTLEFASTLDGRGKPLVPAEAVRPLIRPFGACLWTQGEAVVALPAGQAEITCTSGPLFAATQQTVDVKPGETTVVTASMVLGIDLGTMGWVGGDAGCRVSGPGDSGTLTNIPLAASICRAEGMGWVCLLPGYGNDPAQGDPAQTADDVSLPSFSVGLATEVVGAGGRALVIGPMDAPLPGGGAPGAYWMPLLKRGVAVYRRPLSPPAWELGFAAVAGTGAIAALDVPLGSAAEGDYFRLWSLLLNHGLCVGVASFSDACLGTGQMPVGSQTFVRAPGLRTMPLIADALRRSETLATTGPIINFSVGDAGPGQMLPPDDQTRVAEIDAWLGAVPGCSLAKVEFLRNGEAVKTWTSAQPGHIHSRVAVREHDSAWFAVRAYGSDPAQAAWTSPVYFAPPGGSPAVPLQAHFTGRATEQPLGAPVAGARVTATPPGGKPVTTTTAADGTYALTAPAASMIAISRPGYRDSGKFLAWDCPTVADPLRRSSVADLLDWTVYQRIREAASNARLDFALEK
jgi:hypothetical protein